MKKVVCAVCSALLMASALDPPVFAQPQSAGRGESCCFRDALAAVQQAGQSYGVLDGGRSTDD